MFEKATWNYNYCLLFCKYNDGWSMRRVVFARVRERREWVYSKGAFFYGGVVELFWFLKFIVALAKHEYEASQ